jgi:hypothetical protein
VFTRKLYEDIGGMRNMRFAHDWDFLLRAALQHRCVLIDEPLISYRIHKTNTISTSREWMLFEICWIYAVHLKLYAGTLFSSLDVATAAAYETGYLGQSINLQGNDKVLWMIEQYCQAIESTGDINAAERLLDDEALRAVFIEQINS